MLRITKLTGAEYLIRSVAEGLEDYYLGAGEAPGVWRGQWAEELGLEGVVEADALRALVNGHHPTSGTDLLAGHRERTVRAFDVTLSPSKGVSLLAAFGTAQTSAKVSIAVVEATDVALRFLEERTAFARVQDGGVRRRVPTGGFAIATFAHRTSRAGDPQLHTHCLIPNMVRRVDGVFVAFDADVLHVWGKAAGTVFQNELQRILTQRLGVAWSPDRNGTREIVGFNREQLRAFSKRTVAIETHLEAAGEVAFDSKKARMKADDRASLKTRQRKDKSLTPERLRDRWIAEARAVGLRPGVGVDDMVLGRARSLPPPAERDVFAALVDPVTGSCASDAKFCEAHVVERVAALSGGRLTVDEIVELSQRFLASELVVRLTPDAQRRRPPEWSTVEHRAVEDRLLTQLRALVRTRCASVDPNVVDAAIAAEPKPLGRDQAEAVRMLCGEGPRVRALVAPAGHGKTTCVHAAAVAAGHAGRRIVVVAPTHKAVAELRAVGLDAHTIARLRRHLADTPLAPGTTVIVDETSQVGTRDAAALIDAVAATPGTQVWLVGDARQGQSVAAGGLAVEVERLAATGDIPAATLTVNRRQQHPAERAALAKFRAGDLDASRAIRTAHGWEHEHATPADTRHALAHAAVRDGDRHGVEQVAVLAVSHADCEDLADRIRAIRSSRGELRGPSVTGPGWGLEPRVYAAGDRILIHANLRPRGDGMFNGATGTVHTVTAGGLAVLLDNQQPVFLDRSVVTGHRPDGTPNLSHAWARTVDGAEGGTWRQVHLLGTPALNRFTGYTGQSRSQMPTHTWNTRPDADHPAWLLADQRTPSEAVADAMRRDRPKTFAAAGDPWVLDRQLRAERDEHAAVTATRPPDQQADLEHARRRAAAAAQEHDWAIQALLNRQHERERLGPLHKLRRGGGSDIARFDNALDGAHRRLQRAQEALDHAHTEVAQAEAAVAERLWWDRTHGWRSDRIAAIGDTLAHHWADVVLRAVRADDPLGFGSRRLRDAQATLRNDLQRRREQLPPDRRDALTGATRELHRREEQLRYAQRQVRQASTALQGAHRRRWGHKDKAAIASAQAAGQVADHNLEAARRRLDGARRQVTVEQHAVHQWAQAMQATEPERDRLTAATRDLDAALEVTRAQRIAAAVQDPFIETGLWEALGPPPPTRGGQAAWCGLAEQLTTWHERHRTSQSWIDHALDGRDHKILGPRGVDDGHRWDELRNLIDHAPEIIAAATRLDPRAAIDPVATHEEWQATLTDSYRACALERAAQNTGPELTLGR